MTTRTHSHWLAQLRARWLAHWLLKGIGITASITLFMAVYFMLLKNPQHTVRVMPLVALDHRVAFVPWAVWPYVSLWLYIGAAPSLLRLRAEMWRYVLSVTAVAVIGCAVFYFWPTMVPDFAIEWSNWPALALIKAPDASGTACPSLPASFALLTPLAPHPLLSTVTAPLEAHPHHFAPCRLPR